MKTKQDRPQLLQNTNKKYMRPTAKKTAVKTKMCL